MGNKIRSNGSFGSGDSDGGDADDDEGRTDNYASRSPSGVQEEITDIQDYPSDQSPAAVFENTPLEGKLDELRPGDDVSLTVLSEPPDEGDFSEVDHDPELVPDPTPSADEVGDYGRIDTVPLVAHTGMVDDDFENRYGDREIILKQAHDTITSSVKQHLDALNNEQIRYETSQQLGAVVPYVPDSSGSDTRGKMTPTSRLSGSESVMFVQPGQKGPESTAAVVKHEMVHCTLDAFGLHSKQNASDAYNPKLDEPVEVTSKSKYRFEKFNDKGTPDELSKLVFAAEQAWEKLQDNTDNYDDVALDPKRSNAAYPTVSPEETLTQMHEIMQEDDVVLEKYNWFFEHGEMTSAYTEVFSPSDEKKGLISYLHESNTEQSPFEEDPYPDAEITDSQKVGVDQNSR